MHDYIIYSYIYIADNMKAIYSYIAKLTKSYQDIRWFNVHVD